MCECKMREDVDTQNAGRLQLLLWLLSAGVYKLACGGGYMFGFYRGLIRDHR